MYVENGILNLSSIIQNRNAYPMAENKYGDDSGMVLLDDKQLLDTIIDENTDIIIN